MSTYGVAGTTPFDEFDTDIEDIVVDYLFDEWSLSEPPAIPTPTPAQLRKPYKPALPHAAGQDLNFFPGFPRRSAPYEILCIQTDTIPSEPDNSQHSWKMTTTLEITMTAVRITNDNIDPELGNMEREVERIINQYRPYEIEGISNMMFKGRSRIYDDTIAGGRTMQTVRGGSQGATGAFTKKWVSRIYCDVTYYKVDTT